MTRRQKEEALAILARTARQPRAELTSDTHLVADLGLDSCAALELIVELEDAFEIVIRDDVVAGIRTVGDLLHHLAACLEAKR